MRANPKESPAAGAREPVPPRVPKFDTLTVTRRLKESGFKENQAEVLTETMSDVQSTLATQESVDQLREDTKVEFRAVREEIDRLREDTKAEFRAVREEIDRLREDTKAEFRAVREEIDRLREDTKEEFRALRESLGRQIDAKIAEQTASMYKHIWAAMLAMTILFTFLSKV